MRWSNTKTNHLHSLSLKDRYSILWFWPVCSTQNFLTFMDYSACMICYLCLPKPTELSFCTLGWASSRTDSTSCSYSCCTPERWRFQEQWWDIWCSRIYSSHDHAADSNIVIDLIYIHVLYLLFVFGSDGWEGEGIETKAWFGQGKERQKPWGDGSRGRCVQKTFHITFSWQ